MDTKQKIGTNNVDKIQILWHRSKIIIGKRDKQLEKGMNNWVQT